MILVVSVLNLILLAINYILLRRGYGQQVKVVVIGATEGAPEAIGRRAAHRVVTLGKRGTIQYFNGAGEAVTRLEFEELADCVGDVADVYIVPRRTG